MDCPDQARLTRFVQGELPAEDVSRLESHLDVCEDCLAEIATAAAGSSDRSHSEPLASVPADSLFVHLVAALARRSDAAPPTTLPVQREHFGPYRVVGTVGQGAMGVVYRATRDEASHDVAIKTVAGTNPTFLSAMRREIAILERLRHPAIVTILESGVIDGDPWYAMELLHGTTLEAFNRDLWSRLRREPRPVAAAGRLEEVLRIYARICDPLGFVHRAGVVHCDLKPGNIFLRNDGPPTLMDFGLLSHAGGAIGRESLEVGGRLRGTLPYLSPELIRGNIADARADLYSLGCLLYESLTGRAPFVARTLNGLVEAHLRKEPTPASELVSGLPRDLDELLGRMLAKRRDQRIGDVGVVAGLLMQAARAPESGEAKTPATSVPYLFRPRMVGRDAIIERVQALRANAAQGNGHLVLLSGESGIGKTFLASEIAQHAARASFNVVTGECNPVAPTQQAGREIVAAALEPLRKLLQDAFDRAHSGGPDVTMRLFGSDLSIRLLARYEPALRHLLEEDDAEDVATLPPPAERERTLRALSDLLDALAREVPLLLVIDDLQWADDLTLALLSSLSGSPLADRRLLVIGLYRTEEITRGLSDLASSPHIESIRIGPLDTSSLTTVIGDLLSDQPPLDFVRNLATHSEGNPFFVAEYLRAAAAEGLLERTIAGWRVAPSAGAMADGEVMALPPSLHALLERRLSVLAATTQRLMEAAAVLGREFRTTMLGTIASATEEEVASGVREMLQRQLVQPASGDALRFLHDKTREAAYARIDPGRRATLHSAAARAIADAYAGTEEVRARYAELAYHLRAAGEAPAAVDYFERAAQHALRGSANADAVRLFREASEVAGSEGLAIPDARRAAWERMTGDALHGLGNPEASERHLLRAVELLGWPMPGKAPLVGLSILSKVARQALHRLVPQRWLESDPQRGALVMEGARAYDRLQQVYYYRGQYPQLMLAMLTTLNLSEQASPSPYLATAYTNAGATAGIVPLPRVAARYFDLAEATLASAYDPDVEMYLRKLHAIYLTGLGQSDRAVQEARRSLDLASRLGFQRSWEETAGVLGIVMDGFEERLDWVRRSLESAVRRGDPQMTIWGHLRAAEIHLARGDFRPADECVALGEALLSQVPVPETMWTYALRGFLCLVEGKPREAADAAGRAVRLAGEVGATFVGLIEAYTRTAQVELAVWDPASPTTDRRRSARAACRTLSKAGSIFPIAVPSYCLCEGERRRKEGNLESALPLWQRGVAEARRLGLLYREGQLQVALTAHASDPATAAQARARAAQIAERLGISGEALAGANVAYSAL